MFESLIAQKANFDQQLVDFIELYARFKEDAVKPAADRLRMSRFAARVDEAWRQIPAAKREVLTHALLAKSLLPEEVGAAMRVFQAKVVNVC